MRVVPRATGVLTVLLGLCCAFLAYATLIPDPCGTAAGPGSGRYPCCATESAQTAANHCADDGCADAACPVDAPPTGSAPCTTLCCGGLVATPETTFALAYGIVPEILMAITESEPRTIASDPLLRPPTAA